MSQTQGTRTPERTQGTSRRPARGIQPRLPLIEPDPGPVEPSPADGDAEWRLDEHTRVVGRLGIAAARARLRSPTGHPRPGPGRGTDPDGSARAPGRAA